MDNVANTTNNFPWGLFQYTEPGCVIRNLKVSGSLRSTYESLGSIVGMARGTTIENCISDATLYGEKWLGGLVGTGIGMNFIRNCAYIGKLATSSNPFWCEEHGIIGHVANNIEIKSCYVYASFSGESNDDSNQFMKITDTEGHAFKNNYYLKRSYTEAGQQGATELTSYDDIHYGKLCHDLNVNGKGGVVWYQHGRFPLPFKGKTGKLVTYDADADTYVTSLTSCPGHAFNTDHVCTLCGALDPNEKVDPLQDAGDDRMFGKNDEIFIDLLRYKLNSDGKATVRGTHKSREDRDMVTAVHIPETVRYQGKDYTVTKIDKTAFKGSKMQYCYVPKTVTIIDDDAFNECSSLTYLHLADADAGDAGNILFMGENVDALPDQELFHDSPLTTIYIGRNLSWDPSVNNDAPFEDMDKLKTVVWGPHITLVGNNFYPDEPRKGTNFELFGKSTEIVSIYFMGDEASMRETDLRIHTKGGMYTNSSRNLYINRNILLSKNKVDGEEHMSDARDVLDYPYVTFGPFIQRISSWMFYFSWRIKSFDFTNAFNLNTIEEKAFYTFQSEDLGLLLIPSTVTTIAGNAFDSSKVKQLAFEYTPVPLTITGDDGITQKFDRIYLDRNVNNLKGSSAQWLIGPHVETLRADGFADRASRVFIQTAETPLRCETKGMLLKADNLYLDRKLMDAADPTNENILFINNSRSVLKYLAFGSNYKEIPPRMFQGHTQLTTVIIPDSLTAIGDEAFKGCSHLEVLSILGEPTIGESAFDNTGGGSKLKSLFFMGKTIDLKAKAFAGNPNLKEVYTGFYDDPGASAADAFDPEVYAKSILSCAGDRETGYGGVSITSLPWVNWRNAGKQLPGIITNTFANAEGQNPLSDAYDRATLAHHFNEGNFEMIYLPFDMDSYYFGVDAEIYRMPLSYENNWFYANDNAEGSTDRYDLHNIGFEKVNIDEEKTLKQGNTYLIKTSHDDDSFSAYGSLFDNGGISVNNAEKVANGKNTHIRIYEGGINYTLDPANQAWFIADDGVLKRINGTYTPQQGRVVFAPYYTDVYNVLNMTDEGNTPIVSSAIDIPFNAYLEGYASFYAADYNYIAPEWCDVYVVTSAAQGESITMEAVPDRTITKGKAVLLKSNNDEKAEGGLAEYLTYATNASVAADLYDRNLLRGVDEDTPANELSDEGFVYVLSCNSEYQNAGFYKLSGDRVMPAGKAYLDPTGLSPQALAKSCLFTFSGSTNALSTIQQPADGKQEIYDIMGRRLNQAGYRGIYIIRPTPLAPSRKIGRGSK